MTYVVLGGGLAALLVLWMVLRRREVAEVLVKASGLSVVRGDTLPQAVDLVQRVTEAWSRSRTMLEVDSCSLPHVVVVHWWCPDADLDEAFHGWWTGNRGYLEKRLLEIARDDMRAVNIRQPSDLLLMCLMSAPEEGVDSRAAWWVSCTWGVPGQQTRRGWITVLDVNPETEISESCYPGQRFPMSGMSVTVGRDDTADVCVDSPAVSRLALWVHEGDDGQWRAMRRGKCAVEVDGKTLERGEKVTFLEGDPIVLNYAVTLCVGDPAGVPRRVLQPVSVNEAGVLQPPGPSLVALRVPDWGFSCYGSGRQAEVVRIALPCVAEEHFEIWRQVHRGADRVLVRPIAAAPLYLLLPGGADDEWTRVSGGWAESPAGSRLNLGRLTLELR